MNQNLNLTQFVLYTTESKREGSSAKPASYSEKNVTKRNILTHTMYQQTQLTRTVFEM